MKHSTFTIAAVQAEPVFLDTAGCIAKACRLIAEAAKHGAKLVVFPEAFIAGYPDWIWQVPPGEIALNQSLYARLLDSAVAVPSAETDVLAKAAGKAGVHVAVGINERSRSGGSVYNSLLFIGSDGPPPETRSHAGRTHGMGFRRSGDAGGLRHADGQTGRTDLLGELYAPGAPEPLREGHRALRRADL